MPDRHGWSSHARVRRVVEPTVSDRRRPDMSLRLVKAAADSENDDSLHLARLLLLLGSADARKTTAITKARAVEGITKLAKMDFLLRYPTCLERVLAILDKSSEDVAVQERERTSIESKMIRFRYGPWDARYRRWLGLLSSRGLVRLAVEGNTIVIGLTDAGRATVQLAQKRRAFCRTRPPQRHHG